MYDPKAPQHIVELFRLGIDNFVPRDAPHQEVLKTAALAAIPIFTLTLSDVLTGRLERGEPTGWRVLVGGPGGIRVGEPTLADVATGGREKQPRLASFSQNPQVGEFFERFRDILKSEQLTGDQGFQLGLLRIPGLILDAFWIQSPDGSNDVFVPIPFRKPTGLQDGPYSRAEFLQALQPLVGKFLTFDRETV